MPDLVVSKGQAKRLDCTTAIAGWVEVHGDLVVDGDLTCLGVSIEPDGSLTCQALITNVIEIDSLQTPARLHATSVRARVANLVQTRSEVIDNGVIDYVHHFGGDLNPSFDYERGEPIADLDTVRAVLSSGKNPFSIPPIVTITTTAKPASDPLADEFAAWAATHPGPQRALLDDLHTWTDRLRGAGPAVERAIKKAVGSPKLAGPRDAWIAELGLTKGTPTATTVQVHIDPVKKSWLEQRHLVDCEILDAANQRITEIPPTIAKYTRVTRVELAYNKLTTLPAELFQLPIESLDVRGNQLAALPAAIGTLHRLVSLDLEDNPIAVLPDELCNLTALEGLTLQNVPITQLPANIGNLTSLTFLSLQGCTKLTTLPESFFTLRLTTLNLHYTRLSGATLARLRTTFAPSVFGNFF